MNAMILFYAWLVTGLIFFISEIGTPGLFFFISGGIGSFAAALVAYYEFSFYFQALVWTIVSVFCFIILRFLVIRSKKLHHKTNVQALIGQQARVTQRIEPHGSGYVKIRGEEWAAATQDNIAIDVNTMVQVVGFSGNKVIVKR